MNFLDDARPPPTDPLGSASRRSACPIAWRGRATSKGRMFNRNYLESHSHMHSNGMRMCQSAVRQPLLSSTTNSHIQR
eukprot:9493963-Pyramimonas_sp.AAC.1